MKKFCWCLNTPGRYAHFDALKSERSDAVALSFKQRVDGYLYGPGTTWTTGRNAMYEAAKDGGYEYLIFADDDAKFGCLQTEGFRRFEALLDEFNPLIASPRYPWHLNSQRLKINNVDLSRRVQSIIAADACVNAFHRDAWPLFLPYWHEFDALSWWNSQHIVNRVAAILWPGAFVQFNELPIANLRHGDYPSGDRCRSADVMVKGMLRPEWRHLHVHHDDPASYISPPPLLRDRYTLTRAEAGRFFDVEHEYWRGRLSF